MGFWIVAAALGLAVGALLLLALLRQGGAKEDTTAGSDIQLYKDQLAEIERDVARNVLAAEEAEPVRVEIAKRLLEADRAAQHRQTQGDSPATPTALAAAFVVLVLAGSVGLYVGIGVPGYADQPLGNRIAEANARMADRPSQAEAEASLPAFTPAPDADPAYLEIMERLRGAVAENPEELQGLMLLARNEAVLGNFAAAHQAQARVLAVKGADATPADYAGHADLLVLAANGYVSPEAEAAIQTTLRAQAHNGTARYYLGLMYAQNGRADLAFQTWRILLGQSTTQAPWVPPILAQIEEVAAAAGERFTLPPQLQAPAQTPGLPGPSAEDMAAAQDMSAADRQEMIRGMVDGLAERLATEGGSAQEWARLINALGVLGDGERAKAIWQEAQVNFANDPSGLAAIRAAAERTGVTE